MPRRFLFIPFAKQHRKTMGAGSDVENTLCCQNTATALQNRRLISERGAAWRVLNQWVQDTHTHKKCDVKTSTTYPVPPRRLCAIVSGEPFSPPCQPGSFPKPVSGTCFSSFCPQTCRTGIWGEVCLVPKGGLLPPRMEDVFLCECQTRSP